MSCKTVLVARGVLYASPSVCSVPQVLHLKGSQGLRRLAKKHRFCLLVYIPGGVSHPVSCTYGIQNIQISS